MLLPFLPLSQRQVKGSGREEKKKTSTQQADVVDGIVRFLEVLNRIKRHQSQKTPTTPKVNFIENSYHRSLLRGLCFIVVTQRAHQKETIVTQCALSHIKQWLRIRQLSYLRSMQLYFTTLLVRVPFFFSFSPECVFRDLATAY